MKIIKKIAALVTAVVISLTATINTEATDYHFAGNQLIADGEISLAQA